jgi:DNA-binding MarR family transcriptional regulator
LRGGDFSPNDEDCVEDHRGSVIRVTETGRKLAAEARHHDEQALRRYVSDALTTDQMDALGTIVAAVFAQLEEPHNP